MEKVITYQAPNGATVNITRAQARELSTAQVWPRNASGEFCSVSHGLHTGEPTENFAADLPGLVGLVFSGGSVRRSHAEVI